MTAKDGTAIDAELLHEWLRYDHTSGLFNWAVFRNRAALKGSAAGKLTKNGYWTIRILRRDYLAHRLAWLYIYGTWPNGEIDHVNGCRSDNRIANLRVVNRSVNMQNQRSARSTSGFLGVSLQKKRWAARISVHGKKYFLGKFSTPEEAHLVYLEAKRRLHEGCTL